jgi:hypothetical protein
MIAQTTPSSSSSFIPSFASARQAPRILPLKPAASPKSAWQQAILQSDLPATVRHVLLTLSIGWMDANGGSCFPTLEQIAEKARLSRQAVARALDQAVEAGYLQRWHWGHGKGNRRWNYQATLPRGQIVTEDNQHPPVIVIENDHKPCPSLTMPKESAPALPQTPPEPMNPRPAKPTLSSPVKERTKTPPPDTLPNDWIDEGQQLRPDLSRDVIEASGHRFINYQQGQGTTATNWRPLWKNWILRERGPKIPTATTRPANAPAVAEVQSAAHRPYVPHEESPEEQARNRERWAANMRTLGIDPDTGERIARPAPAPIKPSSTVQGRLAELKAAVGGGS